MKRFQLQLDCAARELRRAQAEARALGGERDSAEDAAAKARDAVREYQLALRDYEAREEGREEVHELRMRRQFDDGREEGWDAGRAEGFAEGRDDGFAEGMKAGRAEGVAEGREQGRKEERVHALEAFDRFLAMEMDEEDETVSKGINMHFISENNDAVSGLSSAMNGRAGGHNRCTTRVASECRPRKCVRRIVLGCIRIPSSAAGPE